MTIRATRFIVALAWTAAAGTAAAVPITIDPQAFGGSYSIVGVLPATNIGPQSFDLAPGTYSLDIGTAGSCSRKSFVVNGDGSVANSPTLDSSGALEFAGSTVRLRNTSVVIAGGAYQGTAWLQTSISSPFVSLPLTRTVVPDTTYRLRLEKSSTFTHFRVDALGQVGPNSGDPVTCTSGAEFSPPNDSLAFSGAMVTLRNAAVRFDPRLYSGRYNVFVSATPAGVSGVQDYVLVPGFAQIVKLSSLDAFANVTFKVSADGALSAHTPAGFAPSTNRIDLDNAATPPTVRFRNTTIQFSPGDYAGGYRLDYLAPGLQAGATSHVVVPDNRYSLLIGESGLAYEVSAAGTMAGVDLGPGRDSRTMIDFHLDTANFRGARLSVSPTVPGDTGKWTVNDVLSGSGVTGNATVVLVQNASFALIDLDAPTATRKSVFRVLAPCGADPSFIQVPENSSYRLACIPQANAGSDRTVDEGEAVTLDGTGSVIPPGARSNYAWTQVGGPSAALADANASTPSFTAPLLTSGSAVLTFQLIVDDGVAFSDADTVNITVANVNSAPVADAGDDFSLREGATGQLNGSQFSYDPDGDGLSYSWMQFEGAPVVLTPSAYVANPAFQAPSADGTPLKFRLQVFDGSLSSIPSGSVDSGAADVVMVSVGGNSAPVADAGTDQTVDETSAVTLDGNASGDSDGDLIAYQWTQVEGPAVVMTGANGASPSFTAPAVGAGGTMLAFRLDVTDDFAFNPRSASDTVNVTVRNLVDPPRCDLARPSIAVIWPPNHKMVEVYLENVGDPNGTGVTLAVTGITQDEPVDGTGDGDTRPDATVAGGKILLRAERAGGGNGRVYRVPFTATSSGQTCSGAVEVSVPRSRGEPAIDDGQSYPSN